MPSEFWTTIDLAGHAVDLFEPVERRADAAILFLPEAGRCAAGSDALTAALNRAAVAAVAPRGENCWWLDRIEPEFDSHVTPLAFLAERILPLFEERFGVIPPAAKLLGRGVGGQGILQLAFRRPRDFPSVAAIDPAIDFHELHGRGTTIDLLFEDRESARQETALLRLHPAGWPRRMLLMADPAGFWFEGADRLAMKLRSMGIPLESDLAQTANGDGSQFFESQVGRAVEFLLTEKKTLPVIPRG